MDGTQDEDKTGAARTPTMAAEGTVSTPDGAREMPCPMCGELMPDLKGGKASICPNCGFKDSCCY